MGRKHTEEAKAKMAEAHRGRKQSEETIRRRVAANTGKKRSEEFSRSQSERLMGFRFTGEPADGFYISHQGYRVLTGQWGHPLATGRGAVSEHRKVLYDTIGPGPHECHWGCGKLLEWEDGREGICADHLDEDKLNNNPDNLAPSCLVCNWHRGRHV